jgi:hypothetical protein
MGTSHCCKYNAQTMKKECVEELQTHVTEKNEEDTIAEELPAHSVVAFESHILLTTGKAKHDRSECLTSRESADRDPNLRKRATQPVSVPSILIPKQKPKVYNSDLSPVAEILRALSMRVEDPNVSPASCGIKIDPSGFRLENKDPVTQKYEILCSLGKGSFGEVKKIKDKKTGEMRAMKVISRKNCQTTVNYFEEIKILKQLV